MNNTFGLLFWFVVVLAMVPLALWLLKRTPMGHAASAHGMRTVGALPISATQRIVTVEVGSGDSRCWLVLGVTPQSINTLHTMLPQEPVPAAPLPPPATAFAQLLSRLRKEP